MLLGSRPLTAAIFRAAVPGMAAPLQFHGFNPPNEVTNNESDVTDTPALFASRYKFVSYNNSAHTWVNNMKAAGFTGLASQYIFCNESQVSGSMTNNIGGIFTTGIPAFADTDYLHNGNGLGSGNRLYETGFGGVQIYAFRPESTTFRTWYFSRIVDLIDATFGVPPVIFLDNCAITMGKWRNGMTNDNGSVHEYSNNDATWRAAVLAFIEAMVTYVRAARPAARIVGNLIEWDDVSTRWDDFIAAGRLDGALYEYTYKKYLNGDWSSTIWATMLDQVDRFTTAQKPFIAVVPETTADNIKTGPLNLARFRFGFASYLLNFSEYTYFFYGGHPYGYTFQYPELAYNLGVPRGPRYRPDAVGSPYLWRRDFTGGYRAEANGATNVGTITYIG